jgi:hypothetical protein
MTRASLLLLAAIAAPAWADVPLSADIPAKGVDRLELAAGAGELHITASPDDAVHVKLVLDQEPHSFLGLFHWMSSGTAKDLMGAGLSESVAGGVLKLGISYPSGDDHGDVKQKWTIAVPARFAASVDMEAGMLSIKDLSGGVTTHLSAGYTDIHVPAGPVHARQSAGRIRIIRDDPQPGTVHAGSTFGLAIMSFDGKFLGPPQKQGFWNSLHFFGNSIEEKGTGKDEVVAQNTAGLATVQVGPLGDFKDYRGNFSDDGG